MHLPTIDPAVLLATYGYWAVLVVVGVESMGVPVPGEATLLAAAVYAGASHRLSVGFVVAAAAIGAIAGDNVGFLLGREGGLRLLHRYGPRVGLDERRLRLGRHLFSRHGGKAVFLGRFIPVLRVWAAFLAGTNRMNWSRFLVCNAAGGILWASVMGFGAFALGSTALRAGGATGVGGVIVASLVSVAGAFWLRRYESTWDVEAG